MLYYDSRKARCHICLEEDIYSVYSSPKDETRVVRDLDDSYYYLYKSMSLCYPAFHGCIRGTEIGWYFQLGDYNLGALLEILTNKPPNTILHNGWLLAEKDYQVIFSLRDLEDKYYGQGKFSEWHGFIDNLVRTGEAVSPLL